MTSGTPQDSTPVMEELISSYLDGEPIGEAHKAQFQELMAHDAAFGETYRAVEFARTALRSSRSAVRTATPVDVRASILASLRNAAAADNDTQEETLPTAQNSSKETQQPVPNAPLDAQQSAAFPPPAPVALPVTAKQNTAAPKYAEQERRQQRPASGRVFGLPSRFWLAAATVAAATLGYFAVYNSPEPRSAVPDLAYVRPVDLNYKTQSYANFAAVKQGKVSFHKETSSYGELTAFFRQHGVEYDLIAPEMPARLLGGVISEHDGHKMAHLVFSYHDTLIYMFQAPREAFSQHTVEVENEVLYIVDQGAWYWEDNIGKGTLAIWEKGATVCAIVADMTPESLQTLLQHKG